MLTWFTTITRVLGDARTRVLGDTRTRARIWRAIQITMLVLVSIPALWQISLLVRVWWGRFDYPWDIEWLESAALYQAHRTLHGQYTYAEPTRGYLPLFHPPVYYVTLALVGWVAKLDYATARTFNVMLFFAAAATIIKLLLDREAERKDGLSAGLLAVGCAAAAVPLLEGFYDLVRADTLAWTLCILAAALADKRKMSLWRVNGVALLMTAALYARLLTVFVLVVIALYVLVRDWRTGIRLAFITTAYAGLVLVGMQLASGGWYWMYTIGMLHKHELRLPRLVVALRTLHDFAPFAPSLPIVAVALALARKLSASTGLWLGMLVAAVPAAVLPFAKVGGYSNDFMPVAMLLGPTTLLITADVCQALAPWARIRHAARFALTASLAGFLAHRSYDPLRYVPPSTMWALAREQNELVAQLEGGVFIPRHPFLPARMGHRTRQASDMSYLDAWWSEMPSMSLGVYLDATRARHALVSGTESPPMAEELTRRYAYHASLPAGPRTTTGESSALRYALRLRERHENERVLFDFEDTLADWIRQGNAFDEAPSAAMPRGNRIAGSIDAKLVSSFHATERDKAMGQLVSPQFVIDRGAISVRVGGYGRGSRVELWLDSGAARAASPLFTNTRMLIEVVWDVDDLRGTTVRLAIVDRDRRGFIYCDHAVLFEPTK